METGAIPDENITASSSAGPAPPQLARLNGLSAWCAGKADDCFLQVKLPSLFFFLFSSRQVTCAIQ